MFLRHYGILSSLARPEGLPSPQATGAAKDWAHSAAYLAMGRDLPGMPLSQRLSDPAAYRRLQRGRRQALEALILVEPDGAALERIVDLICMIAEESAWSQNAKGAPFDDEQHPEIDFQCAETLMLLAWTQRALGERLGSRVSAKLLHEARRRVFSPFLAHGDYPFMRFTGLPGAGCDRPMCVLCDILLSAILLETDAARRGAVLKLALRLLDEAVQSREDRALPLADELAETAAITDLCLLLRKLTRCEVDLTAEYPTPDWLDGLLFAWLESDFFADPVTGDMRPPLSGQELFRVGLAANDEALTALGARLHRARKQPSATVTGRILDLSCAGMLAAEGNKPPRLKHAATARNRLMLSRFSGFTCAMHTGGGRGNAGSLLFFAGEKPILAELPGRAGVPLIGGHAQLDAPRAQAPEAAFGGDVCPADFEVQPERELMSVDLTRAYPAAASARSVQRTAMVLRREDALRLVDAFDLETPAPIAFRFFTPQNPERLMSGVRLGPVDLTWEGELRCDIARTEQRFPSGDAVGSPLYLVTLTTPQPVSRGFFTFALTPAQ
ncbi:MAG: hypothetical protein IJ769_10885 [Clostridia bacterium]|nr:hypothetical protein [Clostridia bacterium]